MTRRERAIARLERRRQWAATRTAQAHQAFAGAHAILEHIPPGQPILIGHHSERHHRRELERVDNGMRRGVESENMAAHHASKAAGIADQLACSIFSDDTDATAALRARIAEREAEAARIVSYNASCRKAAKEGQEHGTLDLLDERQKKDLLSVARVCSYQLGRGMSFPAYKLANLRANINRDKDRLQQIERQAQRQEKAAAAGGCLIEGTGVYCRVTFTERPDWEIIEELKAAGYHWGRGSWTGERQKLPAILKANMIPTPENEPLTTYPVDVPQVAAMA
jgi:hypothetical protein